MDKDLKKQLNDLEGIKPSNEFKSSLKTDLFGEEKSILLQIVQPNFAFGSLAMAGMIFALITISGFKPFPQIEMVENKISPKVAQIVQEMKNKEDQKQMGMMAMEDTEEKMVARVDFTNISDESLRKLSKEEREELKQDIDQVLVKLSKVEESMKDSNVLAVLKELDK